jgi:16S rRNA (uracil1498-N3)-methyltransferase
MILFYHPDISDGSTFILSQEESKHIARVLRKRVGDSLHITDGMGFLYAATLLEVHPSGCVVQTTERAPGEDNTPFTLHLAVSPLRNPARWEWLLEKATEAGVREITPVICHRTERHQIKPERWNKILVSAMKQSLRTYLPVIHPPVPFRQLVTESTMVQQYIAWCSDEFSRVMLKDVLETQKDVLILIGPEGDFTPAEVELALQHRFAAVSLGNVRLRSETAALAACFAFMLANG